MKPPSFKITIISVYVFQIIHEIGDNIYKILKIINFLDRFFVIISDF